MQQRSLPILRAFLLLAIALALAGCGLLPKKQPQNRLEIKSVRSTGSEVVLTEAKLAADVRRFADAYSTRLAQAAEEVVARSTNSEMRIQAMGIRLTRATAAINIALEPSAPLSLLDMVAETTLARTAAEKYWGPKLFGEAGAPLVETTRQLESDAWELADQVLTAEQQTELRQMIDKWLQRNPDLRYLGLIRLREFAPQVIEEKGVSVLNTSSFFSLFFLDPLASLDPTTRQLAETRAFADRAVFVLQRFPNLLRWQTELLSQNLVNLPEIRSVLTNASVVSSSVNRFATAAEKLPEQISAERKALVDEFNSAESRLKALSSDLRQTLNAGNETTTNLNSALLSFHAVVDSLTPTGPRRTNAHPFNILEYAKTATEISTAAQQLSALLNTFDHTLQSPGWEKRFPLLNDAVDHAGTRGKDLVDYAFHRAIWLILLLCVAVPAAIISCRLLQRRLVNRSAEEVSEPVLK